MALRLVRGHRWPDLLDHLATEVQKHFSDPFQIPRVVVSSAPTGRIVSQEIARRLGISAGIDFLTAAQMMSRFADLAGVSNERARWLGTALELATWEAIESLADTHPVLARAADPTRGGGRRAAATQLAQLQRWYLDTVPELVAAWLNGEDVDPQGGPLAPRCSWQPSLMRASVDALEIDPLEALVAIDEVASQDSTPTIVFAVDDLTAPQRSTLLSLPEETVIAVVDSPGDSWASANAAHIEELVASSALPKPTVLLHDSHGPARQVEVLRDELSRAFAEDPTLQPRDVVVICPRPERYARLLDSAFAPSTEAGTHPGRTLRMQRVTGQMINPLLEVLSTVIRLGELRASATQIVELLLSPPLAHRWRLTDRQAVIELVEGAGIRWGMDASHRATFALEGLAQNTWMRGLDRLLVGLAVADGHGGALDLAGSASVQSSDLETVGAISEVVSRLRRLIAQTVQPANVTEWVSRTRAAMSDLLGVSHDDEWQLLHANSVLARLEAEHVDSSTVLTRREFGRILTDTPHLPRARVAAGNGSLLVAPLSELRHVEHRLVALLGVNDDVVPGAVSSVPDSIDLGDKAPDARTQRLAHLLGHAERAERLLIIREAYSQRTNAHVTPPSAISWLLEQLGVDPTPVAHPPTSTSASNFAGLPSFDAAAHAGALAHRSSAPAGSVRARRREQARTRALGPIAPQVSVAQVSRFLADPAKSFLRSAAGLPLFTDSTLADEVPLELSGLAQWSVVNSLLDALKQGTSLDVVIRRLRTNEELPPEQIGKAEFAKAQQRAEQLWAVAGPAWHNEIDDLPIDLEFDLAGLGSIRIVDEIRRRGQACVAITASKGDEKLIEPWLESLVLSAAGHPTQGQLFRLIQDPSDFRSSIPDTRTVMAPDSASARTKLACVLRAYALGQHRLIPLPAAAGMRYAAERDNGSFEERAWRGEPGFRHAKWRQFPQAWSVFYDPEVHDLLSDPPTIEDPRNGEASAFGAWAVELYSGMWGRA